MANTIKPRGEGWKTTINGVEVEFKNGGLMLGTGLDQVFISGDQLRLVDPTSRVQGHYPDFYPFTQPHEHNLDEEDTDLVLDRTYPPDGIALELLPRAIRELKNMILGNVSIKANFPKNEVTGEYIGDLQKGDLVTWDKESGTWIAATCPTQRGLTDNALFTGVAFPDSDEILSASNVVCDAWNLIPGQAYYLDCLNPGKMTTEDTGYYVGVAQSQTAMYFAPYASSVEQVMTKLQEQMSATSKQVEELLEDFEGVQKTVEEMQAIVEQVKENDDQVNDKLAQLQTMANEANAKIIANMQKIAELEAKDVEYLGYFNSIASQFQTVSSTITNMVNSLSASDEEIRKSVAEVQKGLDAVNEIIGQGTESFRALVEKHEADIKDINDRLGDCTCESIKEHFTEVEGTLAKHQSSLDTHQTSIYNLSAMNKATNEALSALETRHDQELSDLTTKHDQEVADLTAKVEANTEGVAQNKTAINQTTARVQQNENEIAGLKIKDAELDGKIDANTGLISANTNQIRENTVAIATFKNDVTAAMGSVIQAIDINKAGIAENKEGVSTNLSGINDLNAQLNVTNTRVLQIENIMGELLEGKCECDFDEVNRNLAEVTVQVKENTDNISDLLTRTSDLEDAIGTSEEVKENISDLTSRMEAVESKNTEQDTAIAKNNDTLNIVQDTLATQTNTISQQQSTLQGLASGVGEFYTEHTALVKRVDALENMDNEDCATKEELATVQESVKTLQSIASSHGTHIAKNSTDVSSLTTRVEVLEASGGGSGADIDLTPITNRLGALETKSSELETKTTSLETKATELETKNSEQDTKIQENTSSIAENTANISTNTSGIAKNVEDIAALQTKVGEIETTDAQQTFDIATLTSGQTLNTTRIETLEAALEQIEGGEVDLSPVLPRIAKNEEDIANLTTSLAETTTIANEAKECCEKTSQTVNLLNSPIPDYEISDFHSGIPTGDDKAGVPTILEIPKILKAGETITVRSDGHSVTLGTYSGSLKEGSEYEIIGGWSQNLTPGIKEKEVKIPEDWGGRWVKTLAFNYWDYGMYGAYGHPIEAYSFVIPNASVGSDIDVSDFVKKSGDTMSGNLFIKSDTPSLRLVQTDVPDAGADPYSSVGFYDKNNEIYAWLGAQLRPERSAFQMTAYYTPEEGEKKYGSIGLSYKDDAFYAYTESTPANALSNEIVTVDFLNKKLEQAAIGDVDLTSYVKKTGDTMTGALAIETTGLPALIFKQTDVDVNNSPETMEMDGIQFRDKNDVPLGTVYQGTRNNGVYTGIQARKKNSEGTDIYATVQAVIASDDKMYGLAPTTPDGSIGDEIVTASFLKKQLEQAALAGVDVSQFVKKVGDTMTGSLQIKAARALQIFLPSLSYENIPATQAWEGIEFWDTATNTVFGNVAMTQDPSSGKMQTYLSAHVKGDSGKDVAAYISLHAQKDGKTFGKAPSTPDGAEDEEIVTANFLKSKLGGVTLGPVTSIKGNKALTDDPTGRIAALRLFDSTGQLIGNVEAGKGADSKGSYQYMRMDVVEGFLSDNETWGPIHSLSIIKRPDTAAYASAPKTPDNPTDTTIVTAGYLHKLLETTYVAAVEDASENGGGAIDTSQFVLKTDAEINGPLQVDNYLTVVGKTPEVRTRNDTLDLDSPTATAKPSRLSFCDTGYQRAGQISNSVDSKGTSKTAVISGCKVGALLSEAELGIVSTRDFKKYGYAPSTPADSKSNEIATADWVRARISEASGALVQHSLAYLEDFDYKSSSLEETKEKILEKINLLTKEKILSGFTYQNLFYSFKEEDQRNFSQNANQAIYMEMKGLEGEILWQAWEDSSRKTPVQQTLSADEFMDIYNNGAMAHLDNCLALGRAIKAKVREATTKEEVLDVEIPAELKA